MQLSSDFSSKPLLTQYEALKETTDRDLLSLLSSTDQKVKDVIRKVLFIRKLAFTPASPASSRQSPLQEEDMNQDKEKLIREIKSLPSSTKVLDLRAFPYMDPAIMIAITEKFKNLRSILFVSNDSLQPSHIEILAKKTPNLSGICLNACRKINNTALKTLAEYCKNLVGVSVSGCTKLTDQGFAYLAGGCKSLKDFRANETEISDRGAAAIIRNNRNLQDLELANTKITDKTLLLAVRCLSKLQSFDTSNTSVTDVDTAYKKEYKKMEKINSQSMPLNRFKEASLGGRNFQLIEVY